MDALVEYAAPFSIEFGGVDPGQEDGAGEIVDQLGDVHRNTDHVFSGVGENFYVFGEIDGG